MSDKTLTCEQHGGTFVVPSSRGRYPSVCGGKYMTCDATAGKPKRQPGTSRPERVASEIKSRRIKDADGKMSKSRASITREANLRAVAERTAQTLAGKLPTPAANGSRKSVEPRSHPNPCVALAYAARERLEPLGWVVTARGWMDDDSSFASLTASRDTELISLYWQDGMLTDQNYNLWNTEVPAANGKPKTRESFMPEFDEMSDREVVQRLAGMRVEWWNSLGQSIERGTIGDNVKITHAYSGTGDEVPGDRVINFIDHDGSGYRSFRMSALMKIGSGK